MEFAVSHREIAAGMNKLAPRIVQTICARAALGDYDAMKTLLPYLVPKAARAAAPISTRVEIDISSTAAAKKTLQNIAAAIGAQDIGMEEGVHLMDVVGRALERMSVVDIQELTERLEKLETEQDNPTSTLSSRQPVSRANGSTPMWGNIVHHPALAKKDG